MRFFIDGTEVSSAAARTHAHNKAAMYGMDTREFSALWTRAQSDSMIGEDAREVLWDFGVEIVL